MTACLLLPLLLLGQPDKSTPPLTKEQYDQVRELVSQTQERAATLQTDLEKRQQELVRRYSEYELDAEAVEKLQAEIHSLQRDLMANYHKMQVKLRSIVGKERFLVLNQRLSHVIGAPQSKSAPKEKRP